jgi:hypothetical protein
MWIFFRRFVGFIGADDGLYQSVAHHITGVKSHDANAFHIRQKPNGTLQSAQALLW